MFFFLVCEKNNKLKPKMEKTNWTAVNRSNIEDGTKEEN
ncbi:hypothetical protein LEP1GSC125_2474 [Leptospira mayottensis 200901122]|uniref:Uncharacterized protein n=1 Tax=Leptospira mayottensis 200901122 TaxID=1193010 RepID=A0AA87MSM8_9LEPT|nr:hypothetical protein LEP1GSC125_2474 [Leptospira mayottensis 200901122]